MKLYVAHDPSLYGPHERSGVDILVTIHEDGTVEAATRPGHTGWTWGPPVKMTEATE